MSTDPQFWQRRIAERLRGSTARHEQADWVLPGLTAQETRAFESFLPKQLVPAAVLMPIVLHDPKATVLFTQRSSALRHHAGQISFPGGRLESSDASPSAAALREAQEEVGLDPDFVTVAGFLPDHIIGTGFRVTPVVGLVHPPFTCKADTFEVAEIFEVPLRFLMDPKNHEVRVLNWEGGNRRFFAMPYPRGEAGGQYFIWGATAGMLRNFYRFLAA